ncbi:tetratricopeptide repeat protein, partial [candidate division KSB1 bacterium]|nr:tetratricopeptide repeat protein [candidate division KSB1 bacterium]NIS27847.1 tetratricopeptide repeat protein [candidate division KSB1 bacterium]NIU91895.1 tetratricopeptide repeat protein [candidate division KSB1 bacterium]NIW22422.1 tetratricopeptide repeat protein [candidate division KSB1 bacterium]NIW73045.1 tetratricopeptide repeat protein [candidate division KSB1 bacterium]
MRLILVIGWISALLSNGCKQQNGSPPTDFEAAITHKNLGIAYLEEEKPRAALREFEKVMALASDQALGYANCGLAYLRSNKPDSAEIFIDKALKFDPDNADVYLLKAEIYQKRRQPEKAIEVVQKAVKYAPENLEALYKLYRLLSTQGNRPESLELAQLQLERLYTLAPNNLVIIIKWASLLAEKGLFEEAYSVLEKLKSPVWNFDQGSLDYLGQAFEHLNQKDSKKAVTKLMIFENLEKRSPRYQQSIGELQTNVVGLPVLDFGEGFYLKKKIEFPPSIPVQFVMVTKDAGLEVDVSVQNQETRLKDGLPPRGNLSFADVDNDGDPDLFVCRYRGGNKLFRNNSGKFEDVTALLGMKQTRSYAAVFVDYNNDKWLDLYLVNSDPNILLQSDGVRFVDVTDANRLGDHDIGVNALFFDYDHEGDLDLLLCNWGSSNKIYRNNLDGTFDDVTQVSGLVGSPNRSVDALFADFDDDGDTDFIILNRDTAPELYMNLRQGRVAEATAAWGLSSVKGVRAGGVADFNNDGFVDLMLCSKTDIAYYKNIHGKRFEKKDILHEQVSGACNDVVVLDYDNDGWVDVLLAGA